MTKGARNENGNHNISNAEKGTTKHNESNKHMTLRRKARSYNGKFNAVALGLNPSTAAIRELKLAASI